MHSPLNSAVSWSILGVVGVGERKLNVRIAELGGFRCQSSEF